MYKVLPTNTRPMQLEVTSEEFALEFKTALSSPDSDVTKLLEISQPHLDKWEQQLTGYTTEKDIGYVTLCRLLSPDSSNKALEMVKCWVMWAKSSSSIREELQYLFLQRIRKFKYHPSLARPVMVEYIVARDFKLGLRHFILYVYRKQGRDALFRADQTDTIDILYAEEPPDYLLLENTGLNQWQSYLLHLIVSGDNSITRAKLAHYKRRNLYREEQKIWQLLNKKLSDN